jgi:outer membrane protein OmpA-like peptidoglycan-associated protein
MKASHFYFLFGFGFAFLIPCFAPAQEAEPVRRGDVQNALQNAPQRIIPKGVSDPKLTKSADPEKKRVYTKDAVVVTRSSGIVERQPYVAIPILFQVDSDELLDGVSKQNLRETAAALRPLVANGGRFVIEGHASAEGAEHRNEELSKLRAAKIRELLIEGEGLDGGKLADRGFGSKYAAASANAPEAERQMDRRVLVVRVQ